MENTPLRLALNLLKDLNPKAIHLMTLTERKTGYEIIFKSLTTDNGTEFADFLSIIKDTKTKIFFCYLYCFGEKETNEKHNSIMIFYSKREHY